MFLAGQLRSGTDFLLHPRERQLELLDRGERRLGEIAEPLGGLWSGKRRRRELVSQALSAQQLFIRDKHYLVRDDKIQIIDVAHQIVLVANEELLHPRERQLELLDRGERRLGEIAEPLGGLWSGKRRRRELVSQALSAQQLFIRDKHYLVRDDKIQIIDEHTGRVMADRAWERGLHQMIECKENVELTSNRETLARISYQRFFRRYLRLGGMSGTLEEVGGELWSVYGLGVVTVPTNRPIIRVQRPDRTYRRARRSPCTR